MGAKLYSIGLSHPAHAARLMLEHKGIEHKVKNILPGFQPQVLRLAGFKRNTVPALKIEGRRVQGSREISRFLDEIHPEPPLFPAENRAEVEEAEAWGESILQDFVRRVFRWGVANNPALMRWLVGQTPLRPVGAIARISGPNARRFARSSESTDERVRAELAELPAMLDRVDALIADGTIGAATPNAADFQIGTSIAAMMGFQDLRPFAEGRPAASHALGIQPDYPAAVPPFLPQDWLELAGATA